MSATSAQRSETRDVDVLIIGAGISGIGAAYQLKTQRPGTSFLIVEGRDAIGGTWSLHKYPGIRSDSDMPTFSFGFKPWTHRKAIADGHIILDYLQQAVDENGLDEHIRFGHRVQNANFDSGSGRWTVTTTHGDETTTFTGRFLFLGTGYYDYEKPFIPDFPGVEDFDGPVIHPQLWPEDLDYAGKKVVVIGSGATAVTLLPAMADKARHITMLQRSPSYVLSVPGSDPITNALNKLLGHERAYPIVRRKNIAVIRGQFKLCMKYPTLMRKLLIANVARKLPRGFDVDTHFTPRYNPWQQRLVVVPDGDLFKTIKAGKGSVVTDEIERFTTRGILLKSGQELEADIVVTATGLNMAAFGKIALSVDDQVLNLPDHTVYKAMMVSGVPNMAFAMGYTNLAWTLKVELVCEHLCRLLDHMDDHGYDTVTPVPENADMERSPLMDMSSGYIQRGIRQFPRAGDSGAWVFKHAYEMDAERLRNGPIEDPGLQFSSVKTAVYAS
ncbi:NAD(P)/FAD-dependent oxidoreductase [Mycobacterium sp. CBMA293]|uniref:flavin-containing monooxygenase n=1 Tax=unclassified Mycolicibacterium TaxID=2636767 RepID=UPI0013258726|nr:MULTISPECIES: NAD(P)/FAD-dependent oxidoreductase [unclassified Mycolicibacterium]MUL48314.1 NAD(P)/FAD-dependent oxidoreductase [Mycolicibacterium sp. CBMA 360]MUL92607.1 NAD(P)/FAD-dependent oxidoreductase [Mycolicibacterium sp. CBMA 230]MUL57519.1 NAD(P)/FAD-dependent oxidoreductase [Mycolicibacterium sp. CBMA 335]MUL70559.1 NAD(P)/FAD-dependent oxidoreductase [Mycolicibacterium sp. CBMA 311]MUM04984.1 FAD-containing monooxygenase EthA [Mycolicibacterium sp. CBMA 213]